MEIEKYFFSVDRSQMQSPQKTEEEEVIRQVLIFFVLKGEDSLDRVA